jgi:RNA polymerase sigma-70 factor, ECF subfamily
VKGVSQRTPEPDTASHEACAVTKSAAAWFFAVEMTDADLVSRAQLGDADARRVLFERYYDDCWRYAHRMLGNADDASDAVQDTFFRAHRALGRYTERAMFREWIFTILVNQCRNAAITRARRERRFGVPLTPDNAPSVPPDGLRDDELARAIAQLYVPSREALLLRYGADMDYARMAQTTGVSVPALKMRVKRACDRLRQLLTRPI